MRKLGNGSTPMGDGGLAAELHRHHHQSPFNRSVGFNNRRPSYLPPLISANENYHPDLEGYKERLLLDDVDNSSGSTATDNNNGNQQQHKKLNEVSSTNGTIGRENLQHKEQGDGAYPAPSKLQFMP